MHTFVLIVLGLFGSMLSGSGTSFWVSIMLSLIMNWCL